MELGTETTVGRSAASAFGRLPPSRANQENGDASRSRTSGLIRLAVVAALGLYVLGGCASSTPAANTGMQGQAGVVPLAVELG